MKEEVITQTPGNMWKILVNVGDEVKSGDTMFIMEVMKTEVPHTCSVDGKVVAINCKEGDEELDAGFCVVQID